MVQRLGSPLISTATLKMTALLAVGVTAILGGPTLYAQFVSPKIAAVVTPDDDRGIWKLPPPPRYLLQSTSGSPEDRTASVPAAAAPKAETVLMKPSVSAPGLLAPPPAPPPAVAALGASDAPGTLPPLPPAAPAAPILPASPALQTEPQARPAVADISPEAVAPLPPVRPAAPAAAPPPHLRTATLKPSEPVRTAPHAPSVKPASVHVPAPPHVSASKSAALHAPSRAIKPRPAPRVARAAPAAPMQLGAATAPRPAAPPPQSQRIPVLSNILDGINSAGQAITNAVPKF